MQVGQSVVVVDKLAEAAGVDAQRHGIDGEVAAGDVLVQRSVLDDGVAAVAVIALAAGADKFQLGAVPGQAGGAEALEHRHFDMLSQRACRGACQVDARAHGHEVDVL